MKQHLFADILSIPDSVSVTSKVARVIVSIAGAIALIGVIGVLSSESGKNASHFFLEDGIAIQADLLRGVHFDAVEKAYDITVTDDTVPSLSESIVDYE